MAYYFTKFLQRKAGVAGGAVCLKGTGVMASVIASRFAAGESLDELAKDYRVSRQCVDAAIRLIIAVKGTSLWSRRSLDKIADRIPLEQLTAPAPETKE